jgi:hypothetical protein
MKAVLNTVWQYNAILNYCFSPVGGQKRTEVVVEGKITVSLVYDTFNIYVDYIVYRIIVGCKVKLR